jgi:hypothetical protein
MSARRSIAMALVWLCGAGGGLLLCSAPATAQRMHVFNSSFGSEGTGQGQFSRLGALAVNDETGDVYVIDRGNRRIEVFSATGEYRFEFNGISSPAGEFSFGGGGLIEGSSHNAEPEVAVDNSTNPLDPSRGDVYVVDNGHGVVDKFTANGVYIDQVALPAPEPYGVAVDTNGALWVEFGGPYISNEGLTAKEGGSAVAEFNDASANEFVREILPTDPEEEGKKGYGGGVFGLAVDSEDNIYEGFCPNFLSCDGFGTIGVETRTALQLAAKYLNNGALISHGFDSETATGVAVDQSSSDVYVDNATSIAAFSPTGVPIERFGSPQLAEGTEIRDANEYAVASEGIAVNSATGTVYASDTETHSIFVFSTFVVPDVSTGSASNLGETTATVNGVVNPDGLPVTSCVFEYGTTTSYGQEAACSPIPSGDTPVAVSANLSGLERLTSYHFRLKVANKNGFNVGLDQAFVTPEPVGISEEVVSDVSSESALFSARIDADGSATSFHFEYGTSAAYGESVPVAGGDLGAGTGSVPVSVRAEGLVPGTTYYVRLAASNVFGVVYGPGEVLTTQAVGGAFALPDGREWEMVSPPVKYGGGILPLESGPVEAAENGSAIAYLATDATEPNAEGNPSPRLPLQVLSKRGAEGWSSKDIALPRGQGITSLYPHYSEYRMFSGDLASAIVEPFIEGFDKLSPEATESTPYLRDNIAGGYVPLVTASNVVPPGTQFSNREQQAGVGDDVRALAATPDLSHVVLAAPFALTANAVVENGGENLYEWAGGRLKAVNVPPGKTTTESGALLGSYDEGAISVGPAGSTSHAVSDDGSKVFWASGGGELYMRDTVTEQTVQVNAPAPGVPSPPRFLSRFSTASADGSKVFFIEREPLTSNSKLPPVGEPLPEGGAEALPGDLYVYDTVAGTLTDLTGGGGASGSEPGGMQGEVLGTSEDGTIVYFVATAALAEGAQAGEDNLYVASETGSSWSLRLVAVLSGEDERDWTVQSNDGLTPHGHFDSSRVSPNGRFLAFMSERSLTGYDNRDLNSGVPDEEVFLYDEATGHLTCASCNPTGERPTGIFDEERPEVGEHEQRPAADRGEWWAGHWLAAIIPGSTNLSGYTDRDGEEAGLAPYQQRYLSDEGRLFFDGFDALAAQATDGKANVYEYEPQGVGSCARPGGCVSMLSPGTSSEESAFMDASENGDDVFFVTASRLTPQDVDNNFDVYDAHACSASAPCVSVPVSPPACSSGDACKAAPSPQPALFGAPASATFSGAGNLPPAPPAIEPKAKPVKCKRGFSAKRGKCVKRARSKKKKAAKSSRGGKK